MAKKYMSLERLQEYDALIKQEIADSVAGKADASHDHNSLYYGKSEVDTKLSGKADSSHSHSNYVPTSRTINGKALTSNITLTASDIGALSSSTAIPSIEGLATEEYVDDIAATKVDKVSGKGLSTNDYTTTEKNKLAGIASGAEVNQNAFSNVVVGSTTIAADSKTDSLTIAAGTGISVAGDATNDKVTITNSGVRSIATGSTNGTISVNTNGTSANVAVKGLGSAAYTASTAYDAAGTAQTKADAALASAKSYTDGKISDLLDGADDTTLDSIKELADAIKTNDSAIDALNDIASGKADAEHTHAISDVSGLQSALDAKDAAIEAVKSDVSNMSVVVLSEAQQSIDAVQTNLDSHTSNTTAHITSTERTNWGAAYTHSQAAHAPSNAEKNQNAFSNITVGSTTVSADTTTDTVTFVGSNVTITPDATNDKITFAVASGSTSAKGIVQLTNSTSSTSTTTAATPSSVKSAYDLANSANTAAAAAQATADGKANASHTHTVANISDLTATATELNYMDGVTSNVQTQLDGKAASSHSHSDATTSAAGFMTAAMVTKLNGIATGATKITVDSALSSTSTNPVQNKVVNSAISTLTSTVSANTSSISSHSTAISNLQTAVSEIQEITSADIQALFA